MTINIINEDEAGQFFIDFDSLEMATNAEFAAIVSSYVDKDFIILDSVIDLEADFVKQVNFYFLRDSGVIHQVGIFIYSDHFDIRTEIVGHAFNILSLAKQLKKWGLYCD
jgi:hypothetical protein